MKKDNDSITVSKRHYRFLTVNLMIIAVVQVAHLAVRIIDMIR